MKKTKHYQNVKFSADVIKEALDKFTNEMNKQVFDLTSKDGYFKDKSDAETLDMFTSLPDPSREIESWNETN